MQSVEESEKQQLSSLLQNDKRPIEPRIRKKKKKFREALFANEVPSIVGDGWKLKPLEFEKKTDVKGLSKHVAEFYMTQNAIIEHYLSLEDESPKEEVDSDPFLVRALITASFCANVVLFGVKIVAYAISLSYTMLSIVLDSFLDIASGSILFLASRAIRNPKNVHNFPSGRGRLEPLAIIVFASVMFTATVEVIIESAKSLTGTPTVEDLSATVFIIIGCTIVTKILLFVACTIVGKRFNSASLGALAQDHRNDVVSNALGTAFLLIARYWLWWMDATGAIIISLYIMITWARTGWQHVDMLSGKTADAAFISRITYLCWNHDQRIRAIDTVRAFHLSFGYQVEVDIVLDADMKLREAHDIGESLQVKIEALEDVDRAHVHLDFETEHEPEHRKKSTIVHP